MCGLLGRIGGTGDVEAGLPWIARRGPDSQRVWRSADERIALLHAGLAIVDGDSRAHEPLEQQAAGVTVAFVGEIYNYEPLEPELQEYPFQTQSDTQAILAAYVTHGVAGLNRLNGMFALAIVDERRRRVYLVRDAIGMKPLFLARWNDQTRNVYYDNSRREELLKRLVGDWGAFLYFGRSWGYSPFQYQQLCFEVAGFELNWPPARYGRGRMGLDLCSGWEEHGSVRFDVIFADQALRARTEPRRALDRVPEACCRRSQARCVRAKRPWSQARRAWREVGTTAGGIPSAGLQDGLVYPQPSPLRLAARVPYTRGPAIAGGQLSRLTMGDCAGGRAGLMSQ